MEFFEDLFIYGGFIMSPLIILMGWSLHYRKKYTNHYLPIIWLTMASLFCNLLALYMREEIKNNMPVFHLYGLLHGTCLLWFFYLNLNKSKAVLWIGGVYLFLYIINSAHFESIWTYNVMAKVTQNALFLGMSFWYFFFLYKSESLDELESNGIFWIVVGILFYHAGAFFSSLFAAKILSIEDGSLFGSWVIHNIASLMKDILFFVGLWMGRTRLQTR
jgi:hypothetical protein